jgi:hypothetical protein
MDNSQVADRSQQSAPLALAGWASGAWRIPKGDDSKGKSATALSFYSQRESIRLGYAPVAIRSGPLNVSLERHAACEGC